MDILFASGNSHKREEVAQVLAHHKVLMPKDLNIEFDPEETGSTYLENALIKARELHSLTGKPVLADDSGISVDHLKGAPGIYSARYGNKEHGRELSAAEKNAYLLKNMEGVQNRKAAFVCAMVFLISPQRFYVAQETFEGELITKAQGQGGFGYDPIVYIPSKKKTVAQLTPEEKNAMSHRGKALKTIQAIIDKIEETP